MSDIKPRIVNEWCSEFEDLFGNVDQQRRPEELWIATMAHCSAMGEGIRRTNYNELIDSAAHAFCWMCSYVNLCKKTEDMVFHFNHSLCDMVYLKFPKQCGYCEKVPCLCDPYKMDEKKDKAAKYERLYAKAKPDMPIRYSLRAWTENVFKELYGGRIHMMTLESIGFHFLEEAAEEMMAVRQLIQLRNVLKDKIKGVDENFLEKIQSFDGLIEEHSKCFSDKDLTKDPSTGKPIIDFTSRSPIHVKARIVKAKMDFVIELADTFSWFCAILIKLEIIAQSNNINNGRFDIEHTLQNIYGRNGEKLKCPTCKELKCKCVFFLKEGV